MFKKKKKNNDLVVECWNLDYHLIIWLNKHLKQYLEDASKIVDLDFEKFRYKGKEITFREAIIMLIEVTDWLLSSAAYDYMRDIEQNNGSVKEINAKKDEMYDLLKLVHWQLWW